MPKTILIRKSFEFEASHVLPKHPGKCSRVHGHSWKLTVTFRGPVDTETGFIVDFSQLSDLVKTNVISRVDHTHLGEGALVKLTPNTTTNPCQTVLPSTDIYPTCENLLKLFAGWLQAALNAANWPCGVCLHSLKLSETSGNSAILILED
jgi:queuosine biosynthesis protein QueD